MDAEFEKLRTEGVWNSVVARRPSVRARQIAADPNTRLACGSRDYALPFMCHSTGQHWHSIFPGVQIGVAEYEEGPTSATVMVYRWEQGWLMLSSSEFATRENFENVEVIPGAIIIFDLSAG